MGRPRVPTVLKVLHNNPGRRPLNTREPVPGALSINCPRELVDPVARAEWKRTIAPAIRLGQVTQGDRALAIGYCELWATWRSQLESALKHPHVVAVGKGQHPVPNPARGMANKSYALLLKTASELGLSPSSRSRVTVLPQAGGHVNPLDRFLRKAEA
jgi:P27 family predicted phage terminase small subunit